MPGNAGVLLPGRPEMASRLHVEARHGPYSAQFPPPSRPHIASRAPAAHTGGQQPGKSLAWFYWWQ